MYGLWGFGGVEGLDKRIYGEILEKDIWGTLRMRVYHKQPQVLRLPLRLASLTQGRSG